MRSTLPAFNEVWQRQFRSSFLKQCSQFSEENTFLVGCSGGMDSMLLLHLMSELCPGKVRAIYVNHQLQSVSDDWATFISKHCARLHLPCVIQAVTVSEGNLENQARQARYQAYKQHIHAHEILVLAHHQQDQAETALLRLFSGTGVQGLSAMKMLDRRFDLTLWRPFLDLTREQICQWTQQLNIAYVDDPTNLDTQYDRAWCRHQLWHILQSRFPKMQQAISRTSYLMQDADQILNEVLVQDLAHCGDAQQLNLTAVKSLSEARQRQLLSSWMRAESTYRPSFEMVQRLKDEVIEAKPDARSALHWNGFYYVRFQQVLYRLDKQTYLAERQHQAYEKSGQTKHAHDHLSPVEKTVQMIDFDLNQELQLASGHFKVEVAAVGLNFALLEQNLVLHKRVGGEKIHLYGRVGMWPLKKAIQDAQIFPWLRHTIQILSIDNVMLGVFTPKGFWLAQSEYCEVGGWQPKLISSL